MIGRRLRRSQVPILLLQGFLIGLASTTSVTLNTLFKAPPRYDGAGYATLAWGLVQGYGYHEWQHPDARPHSHFPPGYPLTLGLLFHLTGRSVLAAHIFSVALTVGASILTWLWLQTFSRRRTAFLLGLSLAANWTWGRTGGTIQSEPLFLFLSAAALCVAHWGRGRGFGIGIGLLLGACILTRHVGICLAAAVLLDLLLRRQVGTALATGLAISVVLLPWLGWLAASEGRTQAGLFDGGNFLSLLARQGIFYLRRIPDQIMGPVVEMATVFARGRTISILATVWAAAVSLVIIRGWIRTCKLDRSRLAGLVPATTFPLLLVWPFTEAGRFLIPLVPFLLVGLAEGLTVCTARLGLRAARKWAPGFVLLVSLPYSLYSIATARVQAQERTHAAFDSACAWIVVNGKQPGPVATHYAADLSWQTGRQALEVQALNHEDFLSDLARYGVAYVVLDEQPFVNALPDPAAQAVKTAINRFLLVWGPDQGVSIYQVRPGVGR